MLTSCATSKRAIHFEEIIQRPLVEDEARIYLFRPKSSLYFLRTTPIAIDEDTIGQIDNGHYASVDLQEGRYVLSTSTWDAGSFDIELDLDRSRTYYVEIAPRGELFKKMLPLAPVAPIVLADGKIIKNKGMFSLTPVEAETFMSYRAKLKYTEL